MFRRVRTHPGPRLMGDPGTPLAPPLADQNLRPLMETAKVGLLRQAMQAYSMRNQAISANLANIDTPGYQRMSVSFEEALQDARRGLPSGRGLGTVAPHTEVGEEAPVLEDEMLDLAENNMRQQLATRALTEHFGLMRTGITGQPG